MTDERIELPAVRHDQFSESIPAEGDFPLERSNNHPIPPDARFRWRVGEDGPYLVVDVPDGYFYDQLPMSEKQEFLIRFFMKKHSTHLRKAKR